ncbi:unnamed protein product, partial [Didymodactylos carnosus]
AAAQTKFRKIKKAKIERAIRDNPELAKHLGSISRPQSGKPRLEETNSGLLGKRYFLLPRRPNSIDGKRQVQTVRVRLVRAQNSEHHLDQYFTTTTIGHLKALSGFLGPNSVFYLSQDDKARIPLGLPAAKKQSPLLMRLDYKVTLPDHDWVVAKGHKLIPSVYGACLISDKKVVTYSGPTFVAIRSALHDSTTASSYLHDLRTLLQLDEFESVAKYENAVKPIVILSVDGELDENPRFPKTLAAGVTLFKENNLDCLFVVTNAPGRSAFNHVERRMAPLSNQLTGLILPHDFYGSHLDDNGETVDDILEIRNFERAARYEPPPDHDDDELAMVHVNLQWCAKHVQQSQYLLQIVKCNDLKCCKQFRSSYNIIFGQRFLPPPLPFKHEKMSMSIDKCNLLPLIKYLCPYLAIVAASFDDKEGRFVSLFEQLQLNSIIPVTVYKDMPYDCYLPSVQENLPKRICEKCNLYFPSAASVTRHKKLHSAKYIQKQLIIDLKQADEFEESSEEEMDSDDDIAGDAFGDKNINLKPALISNFSAWLKSDLIADTQEEEQ